MVRGAPAFEALLLQRDVVVAGRETLASRKTLLSFVVLVVLVCSLGFKFLPWARGQDGQAWVVEELEVAINNASLEEHEGDIRGFGDNFTDHIEDTIDHYDEWADKYDNIQQEAGFNDPDMILKYLIENNYSKNLSIADFGCGTGLLGSALRKAGYYNVVGFDGSPEMLRVCEAKLITGKPIYKHLQQHLIGTDNPSDLYSLRFDLVVSSACLMQGHFPRACFDVFWHALKEGTGEMIFSIRDEDLRKDLAWEWNYAAKLDQLCKKEKIKKIADVPYTKFKGIDMGTGSIEEEGAHIMAFQKLPWQKSWEFSDLGTVKRMRHAGHEFLHVRELPW